MSTRLTITTTAALALAALALVSPGGPAHAAIQPGHITITLEPIADGLVSPVSAVHAGDGSGRLFVVDQIGTIRIIEGGELLDEPFLDLRDRVVAVNPFYDERGLLGLAFHPRYSENGRFFVRYSAPRAGGPGEPCVGTSRGCHAEVLAEFRVSGDPDRADPIEKVLLRVDEPQFNHNAGDVAFGPDGMLYVSFGDGGGAGDGLADSPPSHGPIGNGQDTGTLLGALLRLDVDTDPADGAGYVVPADNPFVSRAGRDEIYAYGFRNPYRFSFDESGLLIVPDVGQNMFEEVNVVHRGGNYGWATREAMHCFDPFAPLEPPTTCTDRGPSGERLLDPVAEYDHGDGIAVVGGFIYRGRQVPDLDGRYVFGDFSRSFFPAAGRLFYLDGDVARAGLSVEPTGRNGGGGLVLAPGRRLAVLELQIGEPHRPLEEYLRGFGRDESGELYVLTAASLGPAGNSGKVYRIGAAR